MKTNLIFSLKTVLRCRARLGLAVVMLGSGGLATRCGGAAAPPVDPAEQAVMVLKFESDQKKVADACRQLAGVGNRQAVAALAALLADEKFSHMARYALETIPDASVDAALRQALEQLHGRPLVGVIGSIGVRRDGKAVKLLVHRLQDPDPEVVRAAARTLGSIGTAAAAKGLEPALLWTAETNRPAFYEGLLRCAEALAADGQATVALGIYDRLLGLALPHQARTAALRGAILLRGEKGLPLLVKNLRSKDFALCAAAARISQEVPGPEATRMLSNELRGLGPDGQVLLAQALGWRADATALPALLQVARAGGKPARLAAIRAMAEIGTPPAVPGFVELMGDKDREVAQAAQEGLASLALPEADAAVQAMFVSPNIDRRLTAMELAARRRMTNAVPALLAAATDFEPKVRAQAIRTLGPLAGPGQIPALIRLLEHARESADLEAVEQALGAICPSAPKAEACAADLAAAMAVSRSAQQCCLIRVLATVGGARALETVRAALDNSNANVRATAVRALCGWNSAEAAPILLQLLQRGASPTDVVLFVRGYLRFAAQTDLPADQRLAMCRQIASRVQTGEQKKLLLGALSSIPLAQSLDSIQPYLADDACKEEAGLAAAAVAEKLMQAPNRASSAAVAEHLDKVAAATSNEDLAKRARSLAEQARKQATR